MTGLTIGSLFSGYGGLDMAVEQVTGATPAWFVEYDAAPSKILAHHWPDVPNYGDVTKVDWATMPPVEIITGGYPCQPFSQAGQRKGTNDDRHLWPYVREAIRHLRPRLVVLENVAGHRSLGFDRVLGDMAEDGMHVRWTSLRASDIGAPHHRERLFIVASFSDSEGARRDHGATSHVGPTNREKHAPRDDSHAAADAAGARRCEGENPRAGRSDAEANRGRGAQPERGSSERDCSASESATDTAGGGQGRDDGFASSSAPRRSGQRVAGGSDRSEGTPDTDCERCDGRGATPEQAGRAHTPVDRHSAGIDFGPYGPAVRRWERLTRPAPAPTELNRNGKPRLAAAFAEWMMGLPEGHVTQVPGISRADQLKAIGNGVCVPQGIAAIHQLLTSPAPAGLFS